LPSRRPAGLRLTTLRHTWYRVDRQAPPDWTWEPFPVPRSRFDPVGGGFRVRYAAAAQRAALRERFDDVHRVLSTTDLDLFFVELTGSVQVLDLRREPVLDALGLDDQISTARSRDVWAAARRLVELVHDWFGPRCHGLAYRSRTTPETSVNAAFFAHAPLVAHCVGTLRDQSVLIDSCILSDGFAVQGWR
jgi:hypothetical protein